MNKSRNGFRGYSRDHAMQGLSKKNTQECGSHTIINDHVNSNVLTESGLTKTALYAPFVTCEDLSTKYGEDLSTKCGEDLSIEYGEDLSTNYCEDLSTKYSQNSTRGPGPDIQKPLKVVVR